MKKFALALVMFFAFVGSISASYYIAFTGCETNWRSTGNDGGVNIDGFRYITMGYACGVGTGECQAAISWALRFWKPNGHGGFTPITIDSGCFSNWGNCGANNIIGGASTWDDESLGEYYGSGNYDMVGYLYSGGCPVSGSYLVEYSYGFTL